MLLHQVADDDCGAAADAREAVDQDAATGRKGIIYESMASCEVLFQVCRGRVQLGYPLIGVLLWEFGVKAGPNGQNVRDAIA